MTFNQMTHNQAKALARFISELRSDWDTHGIESALGRAREMAPAPDLAVAAIKAASSAHNRTPSVIGMEGPHWRGSESKPHHKSPEPHERCSICAHRRDKCRSLWAGDHEFQPDIKAPTEIDVPRVIEAIKAEIVPAPVIAEPKPLANLLPADRNEHAEAARAAMTTTHPTAAREGWATTEESAHG